ncbi:unnamed protein product [Rotaria sp. Silwood2]|nr:unnamed protein product [Rotaria sp. Silwood2]
MAHSSSSQPKTPRDQENQSNTISEKADDTKSRLLPSSIKESSASTRYVGATARPFDDFALLETDFDARNEILIRPEARSFDEILVGTTDADTKVGTIKKSGDNSSSWNNEKA